jgi:pimeloyl-ACP methyl ester carboxylesterase
MTLIHAKEFGRSTPALLLLHGLGANGAVWDPLLTLARESWPGRIVVPDLRGHGSSDWAKHYGYGQHANDVAELFERDEPIHVIGHSMGGVVGLALGSGWYGVKVQHVFAFGVKVVWTDDDLARTAAMSRRPVQWFESRSEAANRMLRTCGLSDLVSEGAGLVSDGIRAENGRFRLALDPAAFSSPGPPIDVIAAACRARQSYACGSEDAMVSIEDLQRYDPEAVVFPNLGHNPHVQDPARVWAHALRRFGIDPTTRES